MMRLLFLLLLLLQCPLLQGAEPTRILLFGDSTMITSYLPKEDAVTEQMRRAIETAWPGQPVEIINAARNGEWIARYLLQGGYEQAYAAAKGADVIFVRFGINDHKRVNEAEYQHHLALFADRLKADFPKATVILESSIYVDPAHFKRNRNLILNPFWEKVRALGRERGLTVCDVYEATRLETEKGNWDLRIRATPKGEPKVLDGSQDAGREHDMAWFTDTHPNREGVRVSVACEIATLKAVFPKKLPTGGPKQERSTITSADYQTALRFPASRLKGYRPLHELRAPLSSSTP